MLDLIIALGFFFAHMFFFSCSLKFYHLLCWIECIPISNFPQMIKRVGYFLIPFFPGDFFPTIIGPLYHPDLLVLQACFLDPMSVFLDYSLVKYSTSIKNFLNILFLGL